MVPPLPNTTTTYLFNCFLPVKTLGLISGIGAKVKAEKTELPGMLPDAQFQEKVVGQSQASLKNKSAVKDAIVLHLA